MAYQLALARLGLKPEYCIAIEDTTNGNLSALAAGLKTIITTHEFTIDSDFIGASLVLDQLGEPENSFTVISGNAFGQQYVDMELLDAILTANQTRHEMDYWENNLVAAAK